MSNESLRCIKYDAIIKKALPRVSGQETRVSGGKNVSALFRNIWLVVPLYTLIWPRWVHFWHYFYDSMTLALVSSRKSITAVGSCGHWDQRPMFLGHTSQWIWLGRVAPLNFPPANFLLGAGAIHFLLGAGAIQLNFPPAINEITASPCPTENMNSLESHRN